MPISKIRAGTQLSRKEHPVSAQDKELAVLYWKLQKKVHTDPAVRTYLNALTRMLKQRRIRPTTLNDVGLEMAMQNRI